MKILGITQRVEIIKSYNERRDCLDQNWSKFASAIGFNPVPLANISPNLVKDYIKDLKLDAIILSGGNSLACIDEDASDVAIERDAFEEELIKQAVDNKIPVIGVCRGLQIINNYFGGCLSPISGHVAVKHSLNTSQEEYIFPERVNSFHNWSVSLTDLSNELDALATDEGNNIEAICHKDHKIFGIMWHPEREEPFSPQDLQLFKEFFHD